MDRLEVVRALAACRALEKVLQDTLEADARNEVDKGTPPTWRPPGITVSCHTHQPWVSVYDQDAWLKWCQDRHPDQVETLTRVRPAFQTAYLKAVAKRGSPPQAKDGEIIPGLDYHPGGGFRSISLLVAEALKVHMEDMAQEMVAGVRPLALPGSDDA